MPNYKGYKPKVASATWTANQTTNKYYCRVNGKGGISLNADCI